MNFALALVQLVLQTFLLFKVHVKDLRRHLTKLKQIAVTETQIATLFTKSHEEMEDLYRHEERLILFLCLPSRET